MSASIAGSRRARRVRLRGRDPGGDLVKNVSFLPLAWTAAEMSGVRVVTPGDGEAVLWGIADVRPTASL